MKGFCALLAMVPVWQCLAEECSDTVGACAGKQASLMQFKAASQKQKKQALALDAEESFSGKLAGFQKFTDEMVAKYGAPESQAPSQDVLNAVGTVLRFIDQMTGHLQDAHDGDVELAGKCKSNIAGCYTSFLNTDIIDEIQRYETASKAKEEDHQACRDSASDLCGQLCEYNNLCDRYDDYRQRPAPSPASLPECVNQGYLADDYIRADENTVEGAAKLKLMEECLEDMKEWQDGRMEGEDFVDGLYPRYEQCNRVKNDCPADVESCDGVQKHFQSARCLYALESNLHCDSFTNCFSEAVDDCEPECTRISTRAAARAADDETGQRLVCLLSTLFGERDPDNTSDFCTAEENTCFKAQPSPEERPGKLAACKNETNINSTQISEYWSIVCPAAGYVAPSIPVYPAGFECPQGGVSSPCSGAFSTEMTASPSSWNVAAPANSPKCGELEMRGVGKRVLPCDDAGACLATHADQSDHHDEHHGDEVAAGAGTVAAPFIYRPDAGYVELPETNTIHHQAHGSVEFSLHCSQATTVQIKAWQLAPDGNSDSFFISANGGEKELWHTAFPGFWRFSEASPELVINSEGSSSITLWGREDGIKFKYLKLVQGSVYCHWDEAL